jgi:DUF1009 family protein
MMPAESQSDRQIDRPVGLLAGWGRYPLVVARTLKSLGHRVCCLGVANHADPRLAELCDSFSWIGAAKLGRAIRHFHRHRVREATMAGKFHKALIYQKGAWYRHLPDLKFLRAFYPHFVRGTADRRDDTLLGVIVEAFAQEGIVFYPATDFAPHLLVQPGPLSRCRPTASQQRDIAFGWRMAKEIGGLDIGQSVCVKDQSVLAVEAIEGTDRCIRRAGMLCAVGGFVVVKVAKPQQGERSAPWSGSAAGSSLSKPVAAFCSTTLPSAVLPIDTA